MAAENQPNDTSPPTQLFPSPQLPDPNLPQPQSHQAGYYYATPQQLYPYMQLFYSNINNPSIKNEQDPSPIHPNTNVLSTAPSLSQLWAERNTNKNISISPVPNSTTNNANNSTNNISSDQTDLDSFDTSGYWNLPPVTYGPLASKSNCTTKQPRIGTQYQAQIPSVTPSNPQPTDTIFEDECVWECDKIPPASIR